MVYWNVVPHILAAVLLNCSSDLSAKRIIVNREFQQEDGLRSGLGVALSKIVCKLYPCNCVDKGDKCSCTSTTVDQELVQVAE